MFHKKGSQSTRKTTTRSNHRPGKVQMLADRYNADIQVAKYRNCMYDVKFPKKIWHWFSETNLNSSF